jgi:hypothetical protein
LDYDDLSPQDMDEILIGRGECLKVYMLHDVLRVIEDYEMDEDDKKTTFIGNKDGKQHEDFLCS